MGFFAIILVKLSEGMKSKKPAHFHEILGRRVIDYMLNDLKALGAVGIFALVERPEFCEYLPKGVESRLLADCSVLDITAAHPGAAFAVFENAQYKITKAAPELCYEIFDRAGLEFALNQTKTRIRNEHVLNGVTILGDVLIGPDVKIGMDTTIYPGTMILGDTAVGEDCIIGPNCRIESAKIGDRVRLTESVVLNATIGDGCTIGPFAHLRPETVLGKNVKIGDFVEVKKSTIGDGSKASHLSYIGDACIGSGVNIGCGSITVNYDGLKKSATIVEDNAFIGCATNLVAPVTVGKGAFTAAGSTITDYVPPGDLGIARGRQVNKEGWVEKRRGHTNGK